MAESAWWTGRWAKKCSCLRDQLPARVFECIPTQRSPTAYQTRTQRRAASTSHTATPARRCQPAKLWGPQTLRGPRAQPLKLEGPNLLGLGTEQQRCWRWPDPWSCRCVKRGRQSERCVVIRSRVGNERGDSRWSWDVTGGRRLLHGNLAPSEPNVAKRQRGMLTKSDKVGRFGRAVVVILPEWRISLHLAGRYEMVATCDPRRDGCCGRLAERPREFRRGGW